MTTRIALFNHKGGVSKTTTTFNLGWMIASKGYKVIIVDTDPQCNLTGMVLGYRSSDEFERFYEAEDERNIKAGLTPAFEARPKLIEGIECIPVNGRSNLFLLPGHIGLAEFETTLGIAQELSGSIQTLQNLPGAITFLLNKTAEKHEADYVIIDMSPSLSAINQNLLMTSDAFIVPCSPDFFSVMAIESLASVLPRWNSWSEQAQNLRILQDATYPFPKVKPKFLGTIIQKYRPRSGQPTMAFQKWIEEIEKTTVTQLVPTLAKCSMMLSTEMYEQVEIDNDYCLAQISDFNSLIATSQQEQTPVFALTDEQINHQGRALEISIEARDRFNNIFSELAEKVIGLALTYETGS